MKRVNFSQVFIAVIMALMVIVVSCDNKPVDKSKYEIIALKDANLQINLAASDPSANGTKLFAAHAKYCDDVSEGLRLMIGARKGQVVFGEPETDVATNSYVNLSAFTIKGKRPDMEHGQLVTIYFRLERKNGRIHKLEIDLIEEAKVETVSSSLKAKLNIDVQQQTFGFVDLNNGERLSYNKIIIDGNEVIDTRILSIFYSSKIENAVEFVCKEGEIARDGHTVYTETNELNYKFENGVLTILGIAE